MKKLVLTLTFALIATASFACSKKEAAPQTPADQQPVAESLVQLEGFWQKHNTDVNADNETRLHCRYILVQEQGGVLNKFTSEIKTSGQCNWAQLKQAVQPTGILADGAATQIVGTTANTPGLATQASPKWDCATYRIMTNARTAAAHDCSITDRSKMAAPGTAEALGRQITDTLGLAN